jgi:hypothetical protein
MFDKIQSIIERKGEGFLNSILVNMMGKGIVLACLFKYDLQLYGHFVTEKAFSDPHAIE